MFLLRAVLKMLVRNASLHVPTYFARTMSVVIFTLFFPSCNFLCCTGNGSVCLGCCRLTTFVNCLVKQFAILLRTLTVSTGDLWLSL